jgi:hypothetical protein
MVLFVTDHYLFAKRSAHEGSFHAIKVGLQEYQANNILSIGPNSENSEDKPSHSHNIVNYIKER